MECPSSFSLRCHTSVIRQHGQVKHKLIAWIAVSVLGIALAQTQPLVPHPKAIKNIHPPGEVDRPEMVKFIVADPASLPGIVVDETAAELVGEWQYSTHTPPYVGLGYLHDMKAGKGKVVFSPAVEARTATGLSQSQFAGLLGVSVRTLQGWEQGRKQPSGAARTLLAIARVNPKAILQVSTR